MTAHGYSSQPFDGAWAAPDWPEPGDVPAEYAAKVRAKGRRLFWIAIRIEPVGDLISFADALGKALGVNIDSTPHPDHRSMFCVYFVGHKNAQAALSACDFRIRRVLKKTGREIVRISYDVVEDPSV